MKIAFVVLCYGKYEMTVECIDKILALEGSDTAEIVIVDNASPDGTGNRIKEKYEMNGNVHVLLNDLNEGYAKGNNKGYQYAVTALACDCVIVMNNDAFIDDGKFLISLEKIILNEKDVSIVAPDVRGNKKKHQNPLWTGEFTRQIVISNIIKNTLADILLVLHIDYYKIKKKKATNDITPEKQYGIMPHGACIVFCNDWVRNESQAFCPQTFLFAEEVFLYKYLQEKGYKSVYTPEIAVRHIGDASVSERSGTERKRRLFINRNQTKSLLKYLRFERDAKKNWNN